MFALSIFILPFVKQSESIFASISITDLYQVVGTMGYSAPEYLQTGRLTSKNDVWSYGVFLYELITGRCPLDRNLPRSEQKLLEWVKPYLSNSKRFKLILDQRLEGKYPIKSVYKLATVANKCLAKNPRSRPKMSEVLELVNAIVEESTETESMDRFRAVGYSGDNEAKKKRSITNFKAVDKGWFGQMWTPKLVGT